MDNDIQRINNQIMFERLLSTWQTLYEPTLAANLLCYDYTHLWLFMEWSTDAQQQFLYVMNVECLRLFSRHLNMVLRDAVLTKHMRSLFPDCAALMREVADSEPLYVKQRDSGERIKYVPVLQILLRLVHLHKLECYKISASAQRLTQMITVLFSSSWKC